ncbi:hypothetical protein MJT46_015506 [Ovis ammon polii x Ovis aries]|nr:hypothetical protein MJT46_015506 [Ovis ammon polii x Ovis aries]
MQVPAEVSATAGEAAVLPCTFTHPHRHYDGPLTAIWRAGEPFAGPQVFRCAAARGSELCQTALSLHGRFRLLGNPRRNDLSLRIERLALADDGRYFCRVEFAGDVHDRYESRQGVRLRVTGERAARLRSPRPAGLSSTQSPRTLRQAGPSDIKPGVWKELQITCLQGPSEWARVGPKGSYIYTELERGSSAYTLSHGDPTKDTCA